MSGACKTDFLAAERAGRDEVRRAALALAGRMPTDVLDAVPTGVIILNACRQIVYCNKAFKAQAGCGASDDLLGMRPGEALGCVHAAGSASGCGTTKFCRHCGAALAILESLRGEPSVEECRMTRAGACGDESLDLQIFTSPLALEDGDGVLVTALDISHEKRRAALERVFFHDVLNGASGMFMYSGLMEQGDVPDPVEAGRLLRETSGRMLETVQAHKDLAAAEQGRLAVCVRRTGCLDVLARLREDMAALREARERAVVVAPHAADADLDTDPTLLRRVLGYLARNALEACAPGEAVTLGCSESEGLVEFTVHNPGAVPGDVRRQIFKRSFSTKGVGRGLGLYAARLVGEDYLGGRMAFRSNREDGTTFFLRLHASGTDAGD